MSLSKKLGCFLAEKKLRNNFDKNALGYILGQFLNPVTLFGAKGVVDAA
jgi:hypothetical protein